LISPHINRAFPASVHALAEATIGIIGIDPYQIWFERRKSMSSDDRQSSVPSVVTAAPGEAAATPGPAIDVLALVDTNPPQLVEPEMLLQGLRLLQERLPGFTQLSVKEKRSHARAANLDPEFIEGGLQAAAMWRLTKLYVKRSGEQLRQEDEVSRRWDETIAGWRAILDGLEAANLKRKHHLGRAILQIYRILGIFMRGNHPEEAYMRPYYENMRRAYQRTQRFRKRTNKDEPAAQNPEPSAE
jgi:hypothetical protein